MKSTLAMLYALAKTAAESLAAHRYLLGAVLIGYVIGLVIG